MKNLKGLALIFILIISVFTLTACGAAPEAGSNGAAEKETITIKHELGETTLETKPEKVVVFDYGILDAIDTIGEDIIGLPKATLPAYLDKFNGEEYEDLGTLKEPNFEKIYEIQPDLIIISARQVDLYKEFEKIAPTVYLPLDGGNYMESFKYNMGVIGQIFDKEELMSEEVAKIETAITELHEEASSISGNALFVMANDGNLSVYGLGSRFAVLYKEFGLNLVDESIESGTHGQKISYEYIVEKDPDLLFVMDRAAVAGGNVSASQIMENELIYNTKAYKNDNINYLDSHIWYVSSGGLTGTLKMVEEVRTAISK